MREQAILALLSEKTIGVVAVSEDKSELRLPSASLNKPVLQRLRHMLPLNAV